MSRGWIVAGGALLAGAILSGWTVRGLEADTAVPFAVANVHVEQNATDGDFEIVFEVKGGAEGLAKLAVVAPGGRSVVDFTAPAAALGMRQFRFESPEPGNVAALRAAYPPGVYTFTGTTVGGTTLQGTASLNYTLPAAAKVSGPRPEARDIGTQDLQIAWTGVAGAAAYIVYLEQEQLNMELTVRLPGSATTFAVPDGFLHPGTEYVLGVGSVMRDGNSTYVESTFTTAAHH